MSNIFTSRLLLRAFAPADAEDLHVYLSEPGIYQFRKNALGEPIWTDTYVYAMLESEQM